MVTAMARATHTAILAVCYFIAPFALFVGLVTIGTFTGDLPLTNLMIFVLILVGLFVALVLIFVRKYRIKALILICSVLLVAVIWYSADDRVLRYLYVAEVMVTPNFDKKCVPADGILFNGDMLRLCSVHDLNLAGWIDLIFKIDGPYQIGRLIDDVNSGNLDPAVRTELHKLGTWTFVFAQPNALTSQHLLSDYYLIRYHMCGNADPTC
jgi:hypothetical protein